jgi:predicted N-acyltransferase
MRAVRAVSPEEPDFDALWDGLPDGGIRMSAPWLRSAQRRVGGRSCALLAGDRAGIFMNEIHQDAFPFNDPVALLFGAPARNLTGDYAAHTVSGDTPVTRDLLSVMEHWRQELYPAAAVFVPYGCQFSLRAAPAGGQEFDQLVAGFMAKAASWGARTLAFLFLSPGDEGLFGASLRRRGFIQGRTDVGFSMPVRWTSFEGYLADLKSGRRKVVRREIGGCAAHGLALSSMLLAEADGELISRLAVLSAMAQRRHGHPFDPAGELKALQAVRSGYGSHTRIMLASRDGVAMAFSTFSEWNGEYWAGMAGQDHEVLPAEAFAHFSMAYYEPIRHAIAAGARAVHWGIGAGPAKVMRGADMVLLRSYFLVADPVRPAALAMAQALTATGEQIVTGFRGLSPWRAA